MLILTRKPGQGFRIGDDIEITITEVSGDKVRVGIEAPKNIKVLRSELSETVKQNVQAAAGVNSEALRAFAKGLKMNPNALAGAKVSQAELGKKPEQKKTTSIKPVVLGENQKKD